MSPEHVVLSSLRCLTAAGESPTPAWELRVYETVGRAAEVVIRLGRPVRSVHETNLLGEPTQQLGQLVAAGREIRFHLPPWKIATLRIGTQVSP